MSNFFNNIDDLFSGINGLLQGKLDEGRQRPRPGVVNTAVRAGRASSTSLGHRDRARRRGLRPDVRRLGPPAGPYLFVPLFGPSTLRDGERLPRAHRLRARRLRFPTCRCATSSADGLGRREPRAAALGASELIVDTAALDRYLFVRDAYLQRRRTWSTTASRRPKPRKNRCHALAPQSFAASPSRRRLRGRRARALAGARPGAGGARRAGQARVAGGAADRQDRPAVQAGNQARIREVDRGQAAAAFRLRADDGAGDGPELAHGHARAAAAADREFRTLLVRTYAGALNQYRDQTIDYKPLRASPGDTDVIVRTEVVRSRAASRCQIDYGMEKNGRRLEGLRRHRRRRVAGHQLPRRVQRSRSSAAASTA